MRQWLVRAANGIRKVAAGLTPFSESVWPGVRNDLFVAHESIYEFFARYAGHKLVLDAGCGTGYGTNILAMAGAERVTGVDIDHRSVRYARKHYRDTRIAFDIADLEKLPYPASSFDLVVASNSLEHLGDPTAFLMGLRRILRDEGTAIIAVPPIYSSHDLEAHRSIHYHRSNLAIGEWIGLFERQGFGVSYVEHRSRSAIPPDFRRHSRSGLSTSDFTFTLTTLPQLSSESSITAIFLLRCEH